MEFSAVIVLISLFIMWNWLRQRYYRQIMQGYMIRDYDAALAACTRAIRLSPRDGVLYHNRAIIQMEKGDHDAALADFAEAIRRNAHYLPAYLQRARLHIRMGNDAAALEDYATVAQIDPDSEQVYLLRSLTYARQGRSAAALAESQRAIDLVQAELDKSKVNEAYMGNRAVTELQRKLAYAHANRGGIYLFTGDKDSAIADFRQALHIEPDDPLLLATRAEGYAAFGDYDAAIADYVRARTMAGKEAVPIMAANISGSRPLMDFLDAGESVARYGRGERQVAIDLWERLIKVDERFLDADWVKEQLEWPDMLMTRARPIIEHASAAFDATKVLD